MPKRQAPWKNRIVGQGTEAPDQLLANPRNWRIHPKNQQAALEGELTAIGWVQQVLVNQRTGFVIDGHLRVALAISREEPLVPVLYVDLSEVEEARVLAALDPLAGMAVMDTAKMAELLAEVALDTDLFEDLAQQSGLKPFDPRAEWRDMPSFEQTHLMYREITMYFASEEDVQQFATQIGQHVTSETKSLWFPPRPPGLTPQGIAYEVAE